MVTRPKRGVYLCSQCALTRINKHIGDCHKITVTSAPRSTCSHCRLMRDWVAVIIFEWKTPALAIENELGGTLLETESVPAPY